MLKKIACLALTLALCLSLVTVPAKAAVVEGTSALAATALFGYMTSTGVPLTVIEGGAVASSTALITDFAAATGVSAAETTATIASGVTIGTGGTIILGVAAVAACAAIAAWVVSNRPSTTPPASSSPVSFDDGVFYEIPSTGVQNRWCIISDWYSLSQSSSSVTYPDFRGLSLTSNFSSSYYNVYLDGKLAYYPGISHTYDSFAIFYRYNPSYGITPYACFRRLDNGSYLYDFSPFASPSSLYNKLIYNMRGLSLNIKNPNPGSYITHNGSNSPLELPPQKSLSIQMPPDFPLSTGAPDPSSPEIPLIDPWLDNAYGPSPLVTPDNAPNSLVDSPFTPDPGPGPDPLPDVDYDPPAGGGDNTEPPEDPDADNPFFVPPDFFRGVWHYVVEAFEYAAPFLLAAVAAWNAMVPTSLQSVFYAAVVLAAVFGLIRRLMD